VQGERLKHYRSLAVAIEELAAFLGATTISYSHQIPESWKTILT
jgi:hypothetical protein